MLGLARLRGRIFRRCPLLPKSHRPYSHVNPCPATIQTLKDYSLLTVTPPDFPDLFTKPGVDICCVIDVSGSMDTQSIIKLYGEDHSIRTENTGLTILDIVLHAVRTIVESLGKDDRLSLVQYSDNANVVLPLTSMDQNGKLQALLAIEKMHTLGATNLWDGMLRAMEEFRNTPDLRKPSIFVLTDGMPNVHPPRGEIGAFTQYKEAYPQNVSLTTFGFGYELDSRLLKDLAVLGGGTYSFIPDGSFVGTIFVNAISNLFTTWALNANVTAYSKSNPSKKVPLMLAHHSVRPNTHNIGTLSYGQPRDIIIESNDVKDLVVEVDFQTEDGPVKLIPQSIQADKEAIQMQLFRSLAIQAMAEAMAIVKNASQSRTALFDQASDVIGSVTSRIKAESSEHPFATALLEDLEGEVMAAFTAENYRRWGRHYIPSLSQAHHLQQCNNFKDPGVQHYGGELFRQYRDKLDSLFVTIPPPVGRNLNVSLQDFHFSGNPCFDGDCDVLLADGTLKKVKLMKKGDKIRSVDNQVASVVCVIKTLQPTACPIVTLPGGLKITPWHPVKVEGSWKFPRDIAPVQMRMTHAVYSFVLDSAHTMMINGTCCVTLGHQFNEPVVAHPYWGDEVIEDLKKEKGWEKGKIELSRHVDVNRPSSSVFVNRMIAVQKETLQVQ